MNYLCLKGSILFEVLRVLLDDELYKSMAVTPSPCGDDDTATRILEVSFSSGKSALGLLAHTRYPL